MMALRGWSREAIIIEVQTTNYIEFVPMKRLAEVEWEMGEIIRSRDE